MDLPETNNNWSQDAKYIREAMDPIDKGIGLPDSLRSQALLQGLEGVTQRPAKQPFWSGGMFSLQSGLSYAVAFALIVTVFYAVRLGNPQSVIDGQFAVDDTAEEFSPGSVEPPQSREEALFVLETSRVDDDAETVEDQIEDTPVDEPDAGPPQEEPVDVTTGGGEPAISDDPNPPSGGASPAVGGGNPAQPVGEVGDYTLTWRSNDPSDPDRNGRITVSVVDSDEDEVAAEVDIAGMDQVDFAFSEQDQLYLVGNDGENTVVHSYAGMDTLDLELESSVIQPGFLAGTRIYQGFVYTATLDGPLDGEPEESGMIALPNSLEEGVCYVSALNVETGETAMLSFSGTDGDVALFDHHLYITYYGVSQEDEDEQEFYVAQIALDGLDLSLVQIS